MRCTRILGFTAVASLTVALNVRTIYSQPASGSVPKLRDGFDVNAIDKSVDPCEDFYHYACGTWLKENPIPPDKPAYSRSSELFDRNRLILKEVLEKASVASSGRSANEQKIGDFYASCMDEKSIEAKGISPIRQELERVDGLKSSAELPALLAHFSLVGVNAFFGFGSEQDAKDSTQQIAVVGAGGLGLPDRDFYFREDAKSANIRKQYVQYMQAIFELFGETHQKAAADAQTAMRMETALAKASLDNVSLRESEQAIPQDEHDRSTAPGTGLRLEQVRRRAWVGSSLKPG